MADSQQLAPFAWLVAAPRAKSGGGDQTFKNHQAACSSLASSYRFNIPEDLRVGTLDMLMQLSDDLQRVDSFVEGTVRKIATKLSDLSSEADGASTERTALTSAQLSSLLTIHGGNLDDYLQQFRWDEAKYSTKRSLRDLVDNIASDVSHNDEELRSRAAEYSTVAQAVQQSERYKQGNLMIRSLTELVKREHVTESDTLTTLFVCIPKHLKKDWDTQYEKLVEFVLPRSSQVIAEDMEYSLCTVVVFKRFAEDFKNLAREKRFTVREFHFSEEEREKERERERQSETERESQKKKLLWWCKTNFGEVFVAWIHVKAIRMFVESVLRFGLPANFQAILTVPKSRKNELKLRETLQRTYAHLGGNFDNKEDDGDSDRFYPYVFLNVNLEWRSRSQE